MRIVAILIVCCICSFIVGAVAGGMLLIDPISFSKFYYISFGFNVTSMVFFLAARMLKRDNDPLLYKLEKKHHAVLAVIVTTTLICAFVYLIGKH